MTQAIALVTALSPLAWPVLAGVLLWRLFPALDAIVKSRAFSVKVAGMELSVQDATEQLKNQVGDLQHQVVALINDGKGAAAASPAPATSAAPQMEADSQKTSTTVLWVDDHPSNNAFEMAQMKASGLQIIQALSTEEAMAALTGKARIDLVISDMGRSEHGQYVADAGLILLRQIKTSGLDLPFMIYSSAKFADRNRQQVSDAGGDGATSSPIELLDWVTRRAGSPLRSAGRP